MPNLAEGRVQMGFHLSHKLRKQFRMWLVQHDLRSQDFFEAIVRNTLQKAQKKEAVAQKE